MEKEKLAKLSNIDKVSFNKVVKFLGDSFCNISLATGNKFFNFKFDEKPAYKSYIDSLEGTFIDILDFKLCTSCRVDHIVNLREEFSFFNETSTCKTFYSGLETLTSVRSFKLELEDVVLGILKGSNIANLYNLNFGAYVSVEFDDPTVFYSDFINLSLTISVLS